MSKRRIGGRSPKHPFALLVKMRCLRDGCRLHHVHELAAENFSLVATVLAFALAEEILFS